MNSGEMLVLLLVTATGLDFYRQQIPNWLTGGGLTLALAFALLSPSSHLTVQIVMSGFAVGILLFLPLFLVGKMGAGDIKLLGMAGSFLGPQAVFWGALFSLIAGGVLAAFWVIFQAWSAKLYSARRDSASLQNCNMNSPRNMTSADESLASHPRRMPYAAAIAVGCVLAYLGFRQ